MQVPTFIRSTHLLSELIVILILLAAMGLAFYPSLKHGPRSDQWCYLLDTMEYTRFDDILRHSYSYNRTRACAPGDVNLFRPVLFTLLAAVSVVG